MKSRLFKVIKVLNREHVIVEITKDRGSYDYPNYLNSGMALVGILRKEETYEQWEKRTKGFEFHYKNR